MRTFKEKIRLGYIYLERYVFHDLENLNDGYDTEGIKHFSKSDFSKIIDRVEKLGIGINGIETFKNGQFDSVVVYEESGKTADDPSWYKNAFNLLSDEEGLYYTATYSLPDKYLDQIEIELKNNG